MSFIEELKITIAKPSQYYKFNESKFTDILRIQAVGIFLTIIIVNILKVAISLLFNVPLVQFYVSNLNIIVDIIGSLIISIVQYNVLSLLYALVFTIINLISRRHISFYTTFIYANHIQVVTVVLGALFGKFVLLVAIAYYIIGVKKTTINSLIGG